MTGQAPQLQTTQSQYYSFNHPDQVVEGWYWAVPSHKVKKGKAVGANVMGRELAIYRKLDGSLSAVDAKCPHRGASLKLGKVEADGLRCHYHRWKFDHETGECIEVPCTETNKAQATLTSWPVQERYGMVWVWTGHEARYNVPEVPELQGMEVRSLLGGPYNKPCHPNVVMLDAIDLQHFRSVHKLDTLLEFEETEHNENCISFENKLPVPKRSWVGKAIDLFYKGNLTYSMTYWNGTSGFVTLGPDFLHFYIMFANRVGKNGSTEGQILLFTKKRKGPLGWLFDKTVLFATWLVGKYFAVGDTPVFESIQYDFQTPIKEDKALLTFIKHTEKQRTFSWNQRA